MSIDQLINLPARSQAAATFITNADNIWPQMNTFATQANALAAAMTGASAGGALTINYTFDTATADVDPTNGKLRLDNATQNAATTIRTDLLDVAATDWTTVLDTLDASTNTVKGQIRLSKVGDGTKWLTFNVTARAAPAGYRNITVVNTGSSSANPFLLGDSLLLSFTRVGDVGATGLTGATGSGTPATLAATVTGNITLSGATQKIYPIATTAIGQCLTAPDATTLAVGLYACLDNTTGSYPIGWRDSTGVLVGKNCVAAGGYGLVWLDDKSTAAGVWRITGSNLEPGLITIDSTLSSTFTSAILAPFAAFDNNTSVHFAAIASGFAAFVVDNTGKVVTTPVTVDATSGSLPKQVFKVTATTAIVFYGPANGSIGSSKAVILSLTGSSPTYSLSVGTLASLPTPSLSALWGGEDFISAPKLAQLTSTLYVVASADGTPTTTVAYAISVSGTTVTIGAAATIIASNSVANSIATYALTATTALVLYKSGISAPFANNAVVISVSGTVCTVNTPVALTACAAANSTDAAPSCLLSATKCIVYDDNNTTTAKAIAITIAGTAVSIGTALLVENAVTFGANGYTGNAATRYTPHVWAIGANTAGLWYFDSSGISHVVILTESAGVITAGTILLGSISRAGITVTDSGQIAPQGTSEFIAFKMEGVTGAWKTRACSHKVSGSTITKGNSYPLTEIANKTTSSGSDMVVSRLSTGDYVVTSSQQGMAAIPVFRSNGDAINYRGKVSCPNIVGLSWSTACPGYPAVASNRLVILGNELLLGFSGANPQLRSLTLELAS